jgi:phosphoribosylformylglycinamidine cyclo-ligase
MLRVLKKLFFNCGVGMIVCVAPENEATAIALLNELGEHAFPIGEIISTPGSNKVIYATD